MTDSNKEALSIINDLPKGPLDAYRKNSTFDWKDMKILIFGIDAIKTQNEVWTNLEKDPLFLKSYEETENADEYKRITALRYKKFQEYEFLKPEDAFENPMKIIWIYIALGMYDWSLALKKILGTDYAMSMILSAGTSRHYSIVEDLMNMKATGCLCLTELSHGSNTKNLQTTATYDAENEVFVLNTSNIEATKVWSGNLGKTATFAILFAQLITSDKINRGLHSFIVPIRNTSSLLPYPGVFVGDLGLKIGLNGLDNGFLAFHDYCIPRECLLNRSADVTPEGNYLSSYKDPNKRLGASLGSLSNGRIAIVGMSCANLFKALVIAIRYSALRRQFGPSDDEEIPVIEYQLQQWRLFPYLAAGYAIYIFVTFMKQGFIKFHLQKIMGEKSTELSELGAELHYISCGIKSVASWIARDGIQECREACGGYGYLKVSGLDSLRNDNDANCTYEGDNNVMLQQTSNFLLLCFKSVKEGKKVASPLNLVNFVNDHARIMSSKMPTLTDNNCSNERILTDVIMKSYEFLNCYLLERCDSKLDSEFKSTKDSFTARCNSQVYYLHYLSSTFIEFIVLRKFLDFLCDDNKKKSLRVVLMKLFHLYGLWSLKRHVSTLYEAEYAEGPQIMQFIKSNILKLCLELKKDAISLCDVISPPDFILNSAIGRSDGLLYKNLYAAILQTPKALERPGWWQEFIKNAKLSKL